MSRVGKEPITIPSGVTVSQTGQHVAVKGPKGQLEWSLPPVISISVEGSQAVLKRANEEPASSALHGLSRTLVANMVQGVSAGFARELEITGVGFRAAVQGQTLIMNLGFSHPVNFPLPKGITAETPKPTQIVIKGIDKQLVGQVAADIRRVFPPEPYKGKGIKYAGEVIRREAGKAAASAGTK